MFEFLIIPAVIKKREMYISSTTDEGIKATFQNVILIIYSIILLTTGLGGQRCVHFDSHTLSLLIDLVIHHLF